MDDESFRETLERVGLTQYQAAAYTAVVELGSASAVEIAESSDVPQARIYDVLRDLESRGLIETYDRGSLYAKARSPDAMFDLLEEQSNQLQDAADELETRWEQPVLSEHTVSVVKRSSAAIENAVERLRDAENDVQMALTPDQFRELQDDLRVAYENDVIVKLSIHPQNQYDTEPLGTLREEFAGTASEVRYRRLPTPFLAIVDRSNIFFAPETYQHPSHEYGLLVNDYSLAQVFKWFFQTALWDSWSEVYTDSDGDLPRTYTYIRDCIRDVRPLVEDGERVFVTVTGTNRLTQERADISGEIIDVVYSGAPVDEPRETRLITYTEQAIIRIKTDDGEQISVGGWGAMLEDIEADRIVVEAVEK
ncbi:Sugar-specific transcriptional regulator TrmB [Haladaptatus litoreus]|uniref:Sugar-specific transcriptional regulator TrmB n=1 Tax=Haladaptatus litoreus TaxID=553468 RepID=A0A1N7CR64_9EURY|nr:TrmB family transcriptional regulator [Haladaptatus litoreus]SIR66093.1 Sugar-specific transcriptional regulator TrmB [Haladaptatus litoreus]